MLLPLGRGAAGWSGWRRRLAGGDLGAYLAHVERFDLCDEASTVGGIAPGWL